MLRRPLHVIQPSVPGDPDADVVVPQLFLWIASRARCKVPIASSGRNKGAAKIRQTTTCVFSVVDMPPQSTSSVTRRQGEGRASEREGEHLFVREANQ